MTKSAIGTLKLQMDDQVVGESEIGTQPARFSLSGDGCGVGLDGPAEKGISSCDLQRNFAAGDNLTNDYLTNAKSK